MATSSRASTKPRLPWAPAESSLTAHRPSRFGRTPTARARRPTPPPASRKYNTTGGPIKGKINVHIVPHTHDDTGWQVTVDQYYHNEVYYVVDTVVTELMKDENRRFMYV